MSHYTFGPVMMTVDTCAPAVYIYLRDRRNFRVAKTVKMASGCNVDLDKEGKLIGIELLEPGMLKVVFKRVIPKYHMEKLTCLRSREKIIEEAFAVTE